MNRWQEGTVSLLVLLAIMVEKTGSLPFVQLTVLLEAIEILVVNYVSTRSEHIVRTIDLLLAFVAVDGPVHKNLFVL